MWDNLEILKELGEGSIGKVYLVYDRKRAARYTVKKLHDNLINNTQMESFSKEIQQVMNLNHPNLVRVVDFSTDPLRPGYQMEFCPAGSIKDHAKKLIGDVSACLDLMVQIANGVQYLHHLSPSLLHRSIKPGNFLLGADGRTKLSDISLPILDKTNERVTSMLGFSSPEQLDNYENVDERADIYSLGASFYFLLQGNLYKEPEQLESLSQPIKELLLKLLAPNREDRPISIASMDSLLKFLLKSDETQVYTVLESVDAQENSEESKQSSPPAEESENSVPKLIEKVNTNEMSIQQLKQLLDGLSPVKKLKTLTLLLSDNSFEHHHKQNLIETLIAKGMQYKDPDNFQIILSSFHELHSENQEKTLLPIGNFIFNKEFDSHQDFSAMRTIFLKHAEMMLMSKKAELALTAAFVLDKLSKSDNKDVFVLSRPFKDIKLRTLVQQALLTHIKEYQEPSLGNAVRIMAQFPSEEIKDALVLVANNAIELDDLTSKHLLAFIRVYGSMDELFDSSRHLFVKSRKGNEHISTALANFFLISVKSISIIPEDLENKFKSLLSQLWDHPDESVKTEAVRLMSEKLK